MRSQQPSAGSCFWLPLTQLPLVFAGHPMWHYADGCRILGVEAFLAASIISVTSANQWQAMRFVAPLDRRRDGGLGAGEGKQIRPPQSSMAGICGVVEKSEKTEEEHTSHVWCLASVECNFRSCTGRPRKVSRWFYRDHQPVKAWRWSALATRLGRRALPMATQLHLTMHLEPLAATQ